VLGHAVEIGPDGVAQGWPSSLPLPIPRSWDLWRLLSARLGQAYSCDEVAGPSSIIEIVGREEQLPALERLFGAGLAGPRALVLEGPAGIGKTTIWREGVALAHRTGATVLECAPAESEARLSFAALGDLLAPILAEVLPELPLPQRRALDVALLFAEPEERPPDQRAVGVATLRAIRLLAARAPVVIAIDDVQWLDDPTALALAFALRRLRDEPVRLLVARRDETHSVPLRLARGFNERNVERLALDGLSLEALHHLLHARLGTSFSRPTLRRVHETSGGNPFYALELARALHRRGGPAQGALHIPHSLQQLTAERLVALPEPVQRLLPYVAALLDRREDLIRILVEGEGLGDALEVAVAAGVLEHHGQRIRFSHPLLASVVYARVQVGARRAIHRRLAELVRDPEEAAVHLGLGTQSPHAAIAEEIDAAAARARSRGAAETAATLFEHAARLTPVAADDAAATRLLAAADAYLAAGHQPRARVIAERLIAGARPGVARAQALSLLAWAPDESTGLPEAAALSRQALDEAAGQPAVEGLVRYRLSVIEGIRGDTRGCLGHARAAAQLAERCDDRALLAAALAQAAYARTVLEGKVTSEARRAVEVESALPDPGEIRAATNLGQVLTYTDALDEARDVLADVVRRAEAAGDETARANILFHQAVLECRAGHWVTARARADESRILYEQTGNEQESASALSIVALLAALRGDVDQARALASAGLAAAESIGDAVFAIHQRGILGLVELSLGDTVAAHEWLDPATRRLMDMGVHELSIYPVMQNDIEALVGLGELDRAEELSARVEAIGERSGRAWAQAIGARGRGHVCAASGQADLAREHFARALAAHERLPQPFEHGRTLLLAGAAERRVKRKRAARELLEQALRAFEDLGATLWADKARGELRRVGVRVAPGALTETETRVAELAAGGLTNREIAAAAFLTAKTVEANLSRAYRKLGIRSRRELAAALAEAGSEAPGDHM
jgi:DNA-binding CsgD family transcriptional regulator